MEKNNTFLLSAKLIFEALDYHSTFSDKKEPDCFCGIVPGGNTGDEVSS